MKYLLVSPNRYDDKAIRTLVLAQGLDFIGMPYLSRLREACVAPMPFYPEDITHRPSYNFLRREHLELFFHPDTAMKQAQAVLEHPRAKELMEAMIIARSAPDWIARSMRKAGFDVSADGAAQYKFHYFNVDLVDSTDIRSLMAHRIYADVSEDRDENSLATAREKAHKLDARVMAAQASIGPLAAIANQVRLGVLPTNIELGKLVHANRSMAVVASLEATLNGWAQSAREFALTAKLMTEVLEQVGVAEKDLQAGLQGLALATTQEEVPTLRSLSGGHHTVEMEIIEAPVEATVEQATTAKDSVFEDE